jgi:hypothetical protein
VNEENGEVGGSGGHLIIVEHSAGEAQGRAGRLPFCERKFFGVVLFLSGKRVKERRVEILG